MSIRLSQLLRVVTLTIVGTTILTTPANAAPAGFERCPAGHFCLFDGTNGTGEIATFRSGSPDLQRQNMDNRASSVANNTGQGWCLFDGGGYTGDARDVFGSYDLVEFWDNRVSSLRRGFC
ncbi:peptidase inhibitor family I36 protein [Nonomuraea sp. NPDC001699]